MLLHRQNSKQCEAKTEAKYETLCSPPSRTQGHRSEGRMSNRGVDSTTFARVVEPACFAQRRPQALQSVFGPSGPFLHSGESVLPHVTQTRCKVDGTCFLVWCMWCQILVVSIGHRTQHTFFLTGPSCSPAWKPAASKFRVMGLGFVAVDSVQYKTASGGRSTGGWSCSGRDDVVGDGLPPKWDSKGEAAVAGAIEVGGVCMHDVF